MSIITMTILITLALFLLLEIYNLYKAIKEHKGIVIYALGCITISLLLILLIKLVLHQEINQFMIIVCVGISALSFIYLSLDTFFIES